jgi:hypothetical protein
MLNRRDVLSALTALPLYSIEKSIDNYPPKDENIDTNYSLCQILILAREKNKSFRRKLWGNDWTIHHGMDNQLISLNVNYFLTGYPNGKITVPYSPSIADLLATDWELGESEYHYFVKDFLASAEELPMGKMGEWMTYNVKPTP